MVIYKWIFQKSPDSTGMMEIYTKTGRNTKFTIGKLNMYLYGVKQYVMNEIEKASQPVTLALEISEQINLIMGSTAAYDFLNLVRASGL